MKTIDMSWADCSNEWFNNVYFCNVEPIYKAFEEAQSAIRTVASAGDIGTLSISLYYDEIEELNMKRRKLVSFCNAIHYEISQMVDNPFSVSLSDTLQAAYDLNPSNFTIKTGKTLWWDKMTSLGDLIKSTITDKDLKADFNKKIKDLDKDKPSKELKDAVKEAKFWEKEFEKSEKCQRAAGEVFTEEVRMNWATMSEAERKRIIEDYVSRIGEVLYGDDKTKVKYDVTEGFGESQKGFLGVGRYISINPEFVTNPVDIYSVDMVIDNLTHEIRHQYQDKVKSRPKKHGISDNLKSEWNAPYISADDPNDYPQYYRQEVERDARGFAALSSPEQ